MSRELLKRVCLTLVLGSLLVFPSDLSAQAGIPLETQVTSAILENFEGTAESIIESAGNEGDYLLQQGAMEALIAIQSLDSVLKDQQDRTWKELDLATQRSLLQIRNELKTLKDGLLEYQDFLYLDASSLLERIPLLRKSRTLRSVQGSSQPFKTKGEYQFRLLGPAFRPEMKMAVSLGGKAIPEAAIDSARAHEVKFSIPVDRLNRYFKQDKVALVPLQVGVYEERRRWISWAWTFESHEKVELIAYQIPIRLLPKTAASSYSLVEIQNTKIAGDPVWSDWGPTVRVSEVGRPCNSSSCAKRRTACAVIPPDTEVVLAGGHPVVDTHEGGSCDAWCGFAGRPYIEAGKVCQEFRNRRASHGGSARLRLQYRPLSEGTKRTSRKLTAVGGSAVQRLEFGRLYETELSPEYASFNLVLDLFNGDQVIVTPGQGVNHHLARFSLEKLGGKVNRLLLNLGG